MRRISLVTAVSSNGGSVLPVDYRAYHSDRADDAGVKRTKNDHFADMPTAARARGLKPRCVPFDGHSCHAVV